MARYQYKGRTQQGEAIQGYLEAASADAVANQLTNSGVIPIDITEAREATAWSLNLKRFAENRRPGMDELVLFSRQMHTLTRAGVPIIRAIHGLTQSTRNSYMSRVLEDVANNLEAGRELSGALARHPDVFSGLIVSMVQVGENTGRLDEAFARIAQYLETERQTRNRIKQALRYPTIVLVAIVAAIVIINLVVIPQFGRVFASFDAELPWATQLLVGVSQFFVDYWPHLLVGSVGLAVGARQYVRTERGRFRWHKLKLRLPVVGGIIFRATLGRFARAFSMALRAGVPLIQGLTVVARTVDNDFVADRILIMRNGIERGESLVHTANTAGLFTPLVLQMLAVGEETGAVDDMMDETAGFYEREVDYDLRTLSDAIEPILIVAIGVMVLILALGVFLPMWDLASAARAGADPMAAGRGPTRAGQGFTLLELAVVVSVIAVLVAVAAQRLWQLRIEAERVAVARVVGGLRSALGLEAVERAVHGGLEGLHALHGTDPMALLAQAPHNYVGALPDPDPAGIDPGRWYFDRSQGLLVYRVLFDEHFRSPLEGPARIRFKLAFQFTDNNANGTFDGDVDGVRGLDLVAQEPYQWIP